MARFPTLASASKRHRPVTPASTPDVVDADAACQRCHSRKYPTAPYREAMGQWNGVKRRLCALCAAKRPNLWQPTTARPANRAARRQSDQQHAQDVRHVARWIATAQRYTKAAA